MNEKPRGLGAPRGRGVSSNRASRFERIEVEIEAAPPDKVPTQFLRDASRSVISYNQSPDVQFDASINPYRGCEHGCSYCYARPTHEYLGLSAGLDFETKIFVKEEAPELLRRELGSRKWTPQVLGLSGVTDPYQPVERKLELSRRCLEVLAECRNPVAVVTKNALVTRDVDLLSELAAHEAACVWVSVTTLDSELARRLEPRTSHPRKRLEAISELAARGIPVGVLVAPVIPAVNDHEIPAILETGAEAGASCARYVLLRLPGAVKDLFLEWLEANLPDRRDRVLSRIRSLRGGKLNDTRFNIRGRGEGVFAEQLKALFHTTRRRHGLARTGPTLSTAAFRRPSLPSPDGQMGLFEPS